MNLNHHSEGPCPADRFVALTHVTACPGGGLAALVGVAPSAQLLLPLPRDWAPAVMTWTSIRGMLLATASHSRSST